MVEDDQALGAALVAEIRRRLLGESVPRLKQCLAMLTDEEIWDIVNYVMSIPFEERGLGEGPYVPAAAPVESVAATNAPAANDD